MAYVTRPPMVTMPERDAIDTLVLELSAALVGIDGASIDDGIGHALERVVGTLDLDAAMLGECSGDALVTRAVRRRGAGLADVAWPAVSGEIARLEADTIVCPVRVGTDVAGAVAFHASRWSHDCPDDVVPGLRLVAQCFAGALQAKRVHERWALGTSLADTIIEMMPGLFFSADEGGHLLRWNRNHEVVIGMTGEQLRGKHFYIYLHPDSRAAADVDFARVLTEGEASAELDLLHVDGRRVPHLVSARRFHDGEGIRVVGVGIDISGLRAAEEQVRRQQTELAHVARVSAVGELVAAIAHELNQPLAAIRANAQAGERMIHAPIIDAQEIAEAFRDVAGDAFRADEVIKRLRELLRKGEAERTLFGVNDLVRGIERLARADASQRGVALQLELDSDLPLILGDAIQLQQVVLNLIRNAVDAMLGMENAAPIVVRTAFDGSGSIMVTVADDGPALDDATFARMFEPFHTTKPTGLGIGLSLSRSIVEAHGGLLWATRNERRGLTLQFTLPATSSGERRDPARPDRDQTQADGARRADSRDRRPRRGVG